MEFAAGAVLTLGFCAVCMLLLWRMFDGERREHCRRQQELEDEAFSMWPDDPPAEWPDPPDIRV